MRLALVVLGSNGSGSPVEDALGVLVDVKGRLAIVRLRLLWVSTVAVLGVLVAGAYVGRSGHGGGDEESGGSEELHFDGCEGVLSSLKLRVKMWKRKECWSVNVKIVVLMMRREVEFEGNFDGYL